MVISDFGFTISNYFDYLLPGLMGAKIVN